jgi:hypothetical protein
MTLTQRRFTPEDLASLITTAPLTGGVIDTEQRRSFSTRLRSVPTVQSRRIDAWLVEQAGQDGRPFSWRPSTARRLLGTAAALRLQHQPRRAADVIREIIDEYLLRAISGQARFGSLGHWLSGLTPATLGLVVAEATNWCHLLLESQTIVGNLSMLCQADSYYNVSTAQTTLRGRRDMIVQAAEHRIVLRVRQGVPGKSAGAGLRTDLVIDALGDAEGRSASRFIGIWPDAGLALSVDGTMENLRAGARDIVRAAVVQRRQVLTPAA